MEPIEQLLEEQRIKIQALKDIIQKAVDEIQSTTNFYISILHNSSNKLSSLYQKFTQSR